MDLPKLERTIQLHRWLAVAIFAAVLAAYALRYAFDPVGCPSSGAESWGQFGDYVGGVLNPLVAFLALYWLTQSVVIQRTELHETRVALSESAKSQSLQAKHAERTVRIGALGSMLDSVNADIIAHRGSLKLVGDGAARSGWAITSEGNRLSGDKLREYIDRTKSDLQSALMQRTEILGQLKKAIAGEA